MIYEILSPKKRKFIEILKTLNFRRPVANEIAENTGISLPTCYRWLRNEKLLKIAEQEKAVDFKNQMPEVMAKLAKKAKNGDTKAIKIYLDIFYNHINNQDTKKPLTPDEIINIIRNARKERNDNDSKNQ